MTLRTLLCIAAVAVTLSVLASASGAFAQEAGAKADPQEDVKHGAVLCVWLIYREVREIGDRCVHEKDAAYLSALDRAIGRIDTFIIENTPMSASQLQTMKDSRANMDSTGALCQHDGPKLYDLIRHQGVGGLEKTVASLLAVRRRPMLAPCL